ncbi:MAG: methylated-DNA--[protein]-cysteine S-methyltransferase [Abyssibacter sp.]|uniref:methylated-DNA--[protein]-cysteine S-methyltransferase n=1 Tax=Abyssibacter sp. TaxID=2320200 RepID=UPI0032196248
MNRSAQCDYDSPLGRLRLVSNGSALTELRMDAERLPPPAASHPDAILECAMRELDAYFQGVSTGFSVPVAGQGTDFQRQVWTALQQIAHGHTCSYGRLAAQLGRPTASRAVGMANGRNPIAIIVPCHRVIGADGRLTGYAGGLDRKRWLLRHEGLCIDE